MKPPRARSITKDSAGKFSFVLLRALGGKGRQMGPSQTDSDQTDSDLGGAIALKYNEALMTAYVYVSLKKSVLDPQGKTIQGALKKMGYKRLEDVRQGKYFELTLDGGLTREAAQAEVERIAREVLTNPVIEEFRFSLAD
jgi:phosphoribosylformylglycinamidine synthase subunit PurS